MFMNTNLMIAGSVINFLLNGLMGGSQSSVQEGGAGNFDSLIKQLLLNTREANSVSNGLTPKRHETSGLKTGIYLKAFNDGLVAKGKSSDNAYLKSSDVNMLTDFLLQCGYTEADAQRYIGKLLEKHPDGMIPLSEFFSQVEVPGASGKKSYPPIIMDPSISSRLDSLLKDFGLLLEEADHMLNVARIPGGGLDLDKLIAQLKEAGDRMKGEKRGTVEDGSLIKVSKKLEELGIQIQPASATGQITMDNLITGMEQLRDRAIEEFRRTGTDTTNREYNSRLTGKIIQTAQDNTTEGKNNAGQLPLDVKSSIDRIIEKAVAANGKLELDLSVPSALKLKTASSVGEQELTGTGYFSEGKLKAAQVDKDGRPSIKQNNYGDRIIESRLHEKPDRISGLNEESGRKKEMDAGSDRDGSKTKHSEIIQDGGYRSVRSEAFSSIPRNKQTDGNFFPEHIVYQLRNQISRAVMRGDRVINLQLNPPELGAVKLSMEIKGNALQLGMIAESISAKEIMLAGAQELKSALLDQGIKLESLDVQVGHNFGRSLMNLNEGSGREHQQYRETNLELLTGDEIQDDVLTRVRSMAERNYLLDLEA